MGIESEHTEKILRRQHLLVMGLLVSNLLPLLRSPELRANICFLLTFQGYLLIPVVYTILRQLALSKSAQTVASGTFCFRPAYRFRWTRSNLGAIGGIVFEFLQHAYFCLPEQVVKTRTTTTAVFELNIFGQRLGKRHQVRRVFILQVKFSPILSLLPCPPSPHVAHYHKHTSSGSLWVLCHSTPWCSTCAWPRGGELHMCCTTCLRYGPWSTSSPVPSTSPSSCRW